MTLITKPKKIRKIDKQKQINIIGCGDIKTKKLIYFFAFIIIATKNSN